MSYRVQSRSSNSHEKHIFLLVIQSSCNALPICHRTDLTTPCGYISDYCHELDDPTQLSGEQLKQLFLHSSMHN